MHFKAILVRVETAQGFACYLFAGDRMVHVEGDRRALLAQRCFLYPHIDGIRADERHPLDVHQPCRLQNIGRAFHIYLDRLIQRGLGQDRHSSVDDTRHADISSQQRSSRADRGYRNPRP